MRSCSLALVALTLASGCANQAMREVPISASEMPASFAYGGLGPEDAHYRQGTHPRTGVDVRQMIMSSRDERAVIVVIAIGGDLIFTPAAFRRRLTSLLPDGQPVEWHETTQTSGMTATKVSAFALGDTECVGMERSLRNHRDAPNQSFSQAIAIGYYCRDGQPFSSEEALEVAAALRS